MICLYDNATTCERILFLSNILKLEIWNLNIYQDLYLEQISVFYIKFAVYSRTGGKSWPKEDYVIG